MSLNIVDLIRGALLGSDNFQRMEAEKMLILFKDQSPGNFLMETTKVLADEQNESHLRQAAGTVLKRIITLSPGNQSDWFKIDVNTQELIKNQLLTTLISLDLNARRASADAISVICSLELPRNQWNDLIPLMSQNLTHQNLEVKKAAILTLGFICEQLKINNISNCLNDQLIEEILKGILLGMQKNEQDNEIKYLAIMAFGHSLTFMEKLIEKPDVRTYILEQLVQVIQSSDKRIKVAALQSMIDLCRIQYHNMGQYINVIYNVLSELIMHEDIEIAIPAIEIWNTIASEDTNHKETKKVDQLLIFGVSKQLIQLLLQNLIRQPDEDEGDFNIQEASNKCLCAVTEAVGDYVLDIFTAFISNTIQSTQWINRQSSVIAFGAMLEGPSLEKVQPLILSALGSIIQLLNDQNSQVQLSTATTLSRIAELHPECILNYQGLNQLIPILIQALQLKCSISRQICWVFSFLSDQIPILRQDHPFFSQIDNLLQALLQNAFRRDIQHQHLNIIDVSFMSIINIIHHSNIPNISSKYLDHFLELFQQSYQGLGFTQQNIQSGLQSGIHTCLLRLPNQISDEKTNKIYQMIINDFKQNGDVKADGIYVISALATTIGPAFHIYLPDYYNYLKHALQKQNEPDVFKASLGALADISRSCGNYFNQYITDIVPALLQCLNEKSFDREIKLTMFITLGDIALGCKDEIGKYLEQILQMFNIAFVACIQLSQTQDVGSVEYSDQLKEKLIESYTCFVHALGTGPQKDQLFSHFPKLMEFIQKACDKSINPTVDFLRMCLALIADIANFYGNQSTALVKTQFTQDIINNLNRFTNVKENENIIKYSVQVIKLLQ